MLYTRLIDLAGRRMKDIISEESTKNITSVEKANFAKGNSSTNNKSSNPSPHKNGNNFKGNNKNNQKNNENLKEN